MMWDVFLKAVGMGLAVAAPVGPIGLLCIRRSLSDGRAAGLATGMGAASADATYGLLVASGFAATGLLSYEMPMAVGGGALLMLLGLFSLRSFFRATAPSAAAAPRSRALLPAYLSTYLLTLSNPMTILVFVGMVAGLGAIAAADPLAPYWLVIGVFVGSALWWMILVQLSLWAKNRMTPAVTRWFDAVSGAVLVVWGAWIVVQVLV